MTAGCCQSNLKKPGGSRIGSVLDAIIALKGFTAILSG
jgi:hypothetical protein